jgi:hypothetical protein
VLFQTRFSIQAYPILFFWILGIGIGNFSVAQADGKERTTVVELIKLVNVQPVDQTQNAEKLFSSLPKESPYRTIASQSLAIIYIRANRYSDAWKALATLPSEAKQKTDSLSMGTARLRVWLLLEAQSKASAEKEFKQCVLQAIDKSASDADRKQCIEWLASAIGLLQSAEEDSCVSPETVDKAHKALERDATEVTKTRIHEQIDSAKSWAAELTERFSEFDVLGVEKAEALQMKHQSEFQEAKLELESLRKEMKEQDREKDSIDDQRKQLVRVRNEIIRQFNLETPGKPVFPIAPKQPKRPSLPRTVYKTDNRTGQRVEDENATRREKDDYDAQLKKYREEERTYNEKRMKFEQDSQTYPARLQAWTDRDAARRQDLQAKKLSTEQEIAGKLNALKAIQDSIQAGPGAERKSLSQKMESLERTSAIAFIALKFLKSDDAKSKTLFRPSNFELLDLEWEATRLQKNLREIP